ncbi:YncE family protein [Halalkalibacterium ligniniphilum]|uniref:YncE family protein n=1 Tax=Halalkalibacterium ligniniphilum TaxID=1134413 RepID=UPI000345D354|nr:YncE family protein [Halalkalibacterium ligniniphilum]
MNRLLFVCLFGVLAFLNACSERSLEIPQSDSSLLIVSHVKEQTLTFIDPLHKEVLLSEDSRFPLTEMVTIADGKMIASSQSESFLILYDLQKGKSRPFLELNQGLTALKYEAASNFLFVADIKNDQVHRIDIEKEELVNSIDVGAYPNALELGNGQLFVLNGDSNSVTILDIANDKVVKTFPVLNRPSGMYFDGEYLWIGGHGTFGQLNQNIHVYNPETGKKIREIEVGLMPVAFYGDETSPFIYALCHGEHTLSKIHKETYEVVDKIEVGQNPNFVYGNKESLFVSNLDGDSISLIDRATFKVKDELIVPSGPYMIVLEED